MNTRSSLEIVPYAQATSMLSHGSLRLDISAPQFEQGSLSNEQDAIAAVRAGRTDLAVIPARAFDTAGVRSFDALIAPLTIDSMTLQRAVLESRLPAEMLGGLDRLGVTGLAILPGPMRLPSGITRPLLTAADYRQARIGYSPGSVARRSLQALGGVPVGTPFEGASLDGLDGVELQPSSVEGNDYGGVVRWITSNVGLWPRPLVVVAAARTYRRLSDRQRDWLRQAARASLAATLTVQEGSDDVASLCRSGLVTFEKATAADIAGLRSALAPVDAWMREDAETAKYLDAIVALKARVGAHADTVSCRNPSSSSHQRVVTAVDGDYQVILTRADLIALGAPPADINSVNEGVFRLVLDRGRFAVTQHSSGACTWSYGWFTFVSGRLALTYLAGGGRAPVDAESKPGEVVKYGVSRFRGQMKWSTVSGAVSPPGWAYKPWKMRGSRPSATFLDQSCPPPAGALG